MTSPAPRPARRGVAALFAGTLFVSGGLLFLIQPMFARMVLPLLGGSPGVWNMAMVTYQVLLLGGYLYAHNSARWLSTRQQVLLHLVMLALPLFVLPIAVPAGWRPPADSNPGPWLMLLLMAGVGLPFFVVSSTSPLLQAWFVRTGDPSAHNPYALYAASNAGNMLALLGYPLLLEPRLSLPAQSRLWSLGFGVMALLVGACALLAHRGAGQGGAPVVAERDGPRIRPTWRQRGRWMLLAFVPSSLMLSVTLYMSTNIAPFPLLWVLPLALYLLTFIIAFADRRLVPLPILTRALPFAILPLLVAILADAAQPIRLLIGLHLVAFTIIALCSHASLADEAPPAGALTEFYLWVSVGGALGGAFNALLAPQLFTSILEYPIVLVIAALAIDVMIDEEDEAAGAGARRFLGITPQRWLDVVLPLSLVPLVMLCGAAVREFDLDSGPARRLLTLGAPALICYTMAGRRLRFGLGVGALLFASISFERDSRLIFAERSFFGVSRVYATREGTFHSLAHGNISHGAQDMRPDHRRDPLTYYTRSGPVGELIVPRQREGRVRNVAVVGLGAGSLACYHQPGESWTFFEIDIAVVRIAQDPHYFTYLRECAPDAVIILGDARLSIGRVPDHRYDLILLDAYSADAIPLHLLTREALALYRRKLAPGGVIAVHISNQYFDLGPVVAALVKDAGMVTRLRDEREITVAESNSGKNTSDWMVVAAREEDLGTLATLPRWRRVTPATSVWTDDFASALSALR